MANDIDIWKDIEELSEKGELKEAKDLLNIYHYRYINYNAKKARLLQNKFIKKYKYNPKVV